MSYRAPETLTAIQILEQGYKFRKTGEIGEVVQTIADEAVKAIEQDGADILMIGCNALMWVAKPAEAELKKRGYDISFVVPMKVSIGVARMLATENICHSNLFYPKL